MRGRIAVEKASMVKDDPIVLHPRLGSHSRSVAQTHPKERAYVNKSAIKIKTKM
jgi:hypothetical protein